MIEHIIAGLEEAKNSLDLLIKDGAVINNIATAAKLMIQAFSNGNKVVSCGNGGSMSDAIHFAEELTGRYRKNRKPLPAIAISDPGYLSCVANDYGYDHVFSRYVAALGNSGDCLLAISTSGNSKNVLQAAQVAQNLGLKVIALTGKTNTALANYADLTIVTTGGLFADRVQELHIKVLHIMIELIERHFYPENY